MMARLAGWLGVLVSAVLVAAGLLAPVPALGASAVGASVGSGAGQNLSAAVAPSWQTNGTVWAIASAGGVVYVGGQFTSVRPPGDPAGTGEVAQSYLAAFSASTGDLITSFNPTLNGLVHGLAVSPDGSTLYVGGAFTTVNGATHTRLVALSTSTGSTLSWPASASSTVNSIAVSPDGSTVYVGGLFTKLNSQSRTYAGAYNTAGKLLPWAPVLDDGLTSVAVAPDDSRVLVGGYFNTINGVSQHAIGSTDPVTGASDPWAATILPDRSGCVSNVKDIVISGSTAYVAAEGTGGGCFDGDFAANVSDGSLIWQNTCLGATQAIAVINGWLYKGSHAHDCAYEAGGFPQQPATKAYHLLDQSLTDGTVGHWTPDTNTSSGGLGPRAMATDGSQLFLGGDFTTVNSQPQQGFARFTPGPDVTKPKAPSAPTAVSTSAGVDSVSFTGVSDADDGSLTYSLYRDKGTTPIATLTATSWPWALPVLHYRDTGLTPGSSHTYRIKVSDGTNTTGYSAASAPVTVSSTSPTLSYQQTVLADNPSFFWQLNETSGTTAADSSPNGFNGIYEPGTTQGVPGPITGDSDTATSFDGNTGLVTSAQTVNNPQTFSIELWFKTTTNTGGKLIGFGNAQTGMSSNYDRHIYMMNDGQLVFGVWTGQTDTIETPDVYNDGQWHYVVATLGSSGMALYVDGQLIGTNPTTSAQGYTGYWRVGGDNLNAWNLDEWGSNSQGTLEPNSYYFSGDIGDVAVYPTALTAAQVAAHYAANALSH
jgi:hypothetical protein